MRQRIFRPGHRPQPPWLANCSPAGGFNRKEEFPGFLGCSVRRKSGTRRFTILTACLAAANRPGRHEQEGDESCEKSCKKKKKTKTTTSCLPRESFGTISCRQPNLGACEDVCCLVAVIKPQTLKSCVWDDIHTSTHIRSFLSRDFAFNSSSTKEACA
jgi:hypothetical protein